MAHPLVSLVGEAWTVADDELGDFILTPQPSTDPDLVGFRVFRFRAEYARLGRRLR